MVTETIQFTKQALNALPSAPEGKRVYYRDKNYPQLYLQVTDRGQKSFQVYAWGAGRPQRVTLGKFNSGNGLAIEQARKKVAPTVGKIQAGHIPTAEKRQARQAETVADLAREYIERHAKVNKKSWKEDERQIDKDILPQWRARKAREITRRDVIKLVESIEDRGALIQARRTYRLLSRMFRFAVGKDIVGANPCVDVELQGKEKPRDRALTIEEIKTLWPKLDAQDIHMDPRTRLLLRMIVATGQRPGDVRQMEWSEITESWWTIPEGKRKKTKDSAPGDHRVYLNTAALTILETAKVISDGCNHVFPSPVAEIVEGERRDKPIRDDALSRAVARNLGAFGVAPFTPHDLRRTASTRMAEAGVPEFDIRRVQGHALPGMGKVYNVYSYDKEKRAALEKWGRKLEQVVSGKRGKVVGLHGN